MQSAKHYLAEAQAVISKADKENRNLTADERYQAQKALERVQEIRDKENLRDTIEKFNGEGRLGSRVSKSLGAPALDFSLQQVQEMHKAAQSAWHYKAEVDSTEAPMAAVGDYKLSPYPFLRDKPSVANLIPTESTTSPTVFYFRGSTAASAAAAVAEGAAKPESSPVWTQVSAPVRKLAHYVRVNDEVLADFSNFRNVVGPGAFGRLD